MLLDADAFGFLGSVTRGLVVERQVQREGAALARHARDADLAAEQACELAADGQAEAGAAVLAAGGAVGLLERLEDEALLVGRDADAGVDTENAIAGLARSSTGVAEAPAEVAGSMRSRTSPLAVNLNALESRLVRICCRRLPSVCSGAGSSSPPRS